MRTARTHSIGLVGLDGCVIEVDADVSDQAISGTVIVGLPDSSTGQTRERVRSAAANAALPLSTRKLTIQLSPAELPKHGTHHDLAIAVAALVANGSVNAARNDDVFLGELALDGRLRPTVGILALVTAAQRAGHRRVFVPTANAAEASLVEGIEVVGVHSLRHLAATLGADIADLFEEPITVTPNTSAAGGADFGSIPMTPTTAEALIVAAAGGHHLYLVGGQDQNRTLTGAALASILPDLDTESALDVTSLRSLSGLPADTLNIRPPYEAPHHTASPAAIIGGGSGVLRPGAAARAHRGILHLDEAPEFSPHALDSLRQPLESGIITISRAAGTARFPARFQLVVTAAPCPCGNAGENDSQCVCTPFAQRRYLGRLSGPLLDRIDIRVRLETVRRGMTVNDITTEAARERVVAAREAAAERLASTPWRTNAEVPGTWLRSPAGQPQIGATAQLDRALERGALTLRGYDRVLRMAWTIADLDGIARPTASEVGRALMLRRAAG